MAAFHFWSRFCIHFLFLLNPPPQAYWLKQSVAICSQNFILARQFPSLRWTHPGSCGHLIAHPTEARGFRMASVMRWGPWCSVWAGPSFHVVSHYSVTYPVSSAWQQESSKRGKVKVERPSSGTQSCCSCYVSLVKISC